MIADSSVKQQAFADLQLLQNVAEFKDKFYHAGWANYQAAKPGTMRLMPPEHSLPELYRDYQKMRSMIYEDNLSFDDILRKVKNLENEINEL